MSTENKIPTTLPAKQAKLMAFINYYHQQLIDNNIITERESLDKFSGLFSQDITQQISFCNNFFDYESTHVKSYKEKTKQSKIHQKELLKQTQKNDKLFIKSYNLLKNTKKWNALLLHHTQYITNLLPQDQTTQDLRKQNPHTLFPLHTTKPTHTHPLYPILTNPTPPTHLPPASPPVFIEPPSSLLIEQELIWKESIVMDEKNIKTLTNVKILQLGETKYLVDYEDNVYNFTTHQYISKIADLK